MGYWDGDSGSSQLSGSSYWGTSAAPKKKKKKDGFSIFGYHPHIPNTGAIQLGKEIGEGILGIGEIGVNVIKGFNPDARAAKDAWIDAGRGVGDFGAMASMAGANLANFAPGMGAVMAAPLEGLAHYTAGPENNPNSYISPQMADALRHYQSHNIVEASRKEGPIRALGHTLLSGAYFAGPVAKALGGFAETAEVGAARAAATGTAEEATAAATKLSRLRRAQHTVEYAAHPLKKLIGKPIAETIRASRDAGFPSDSVLPEKPATPQEVLADRPVIEGYKPGPGEPGYEFKLPEEHERPPAPGMKRLFNGGNGDPTWFTEERARAEKYAGQDRLRHVDVPEAEAEGMRAKTGPDGQPTEGDYRMTPGELDAHKANIVDHPMPAEVTTDLAGDLAGEIRKLEEMKAAEDPATQAAQTITEEAPAEKLPKVAEDPRNPRPKEAKAEAQGYIKTVVDMAQGKARRSSVADALKAQLGQDVPEWATKLTSHFSPSVNRVIGRLAEPIERRRIHELLRDHARFVEIAQREVKNSPAFQAMRAIGDIIRMRHPELTDRQIEEMVGQATSAEVDGRTFVDQFIKSGHDPKLEQALRDEVQRGYENIPDEILQSFNPDELVELRRMIDDAAVKVSELQRQTYNTLLSSSKGAQGLEMAVLGDDGPIMSPEQVHRYNRILADIRLRAKLEEKIPDAELARRAEAERAEILAGERSQEARDLQDKIGVEERSAQSLLDPIPDAIREAKIEGTIDTVLDTASDNRIVDVGKGIAETPTAGYIIAAAAQWEPIPVERFVTEGRALVREALLNPKMPDGGIYENGVWSGPDARLRLQIRPDAQGINVVHGEIVMSSVGGGPMPRWQAEWLGLAHRQPSIFDVARGEDIPLVQQPIAQDLAAIYSQDALNPDSAFAKFATKLEKSVSTTNDGRKLVRGDRNNILPTLRMYATWDHSLSMTNPQWKQGDYFKLADISTGKNAPIAEALLGQTGLNLTTADAVAKAFQTLDFNTVQRALGWYYDSHDFIEKTWRYNKDGSVKMITLLDGSQRPAAEVFYDLLAVTSVMADPQTNLGRALTGVANLEDFLAKKKGDFEKTRKVMERLEKQPNTRHRYLDVGTPKERLSPDQSKGTLLSDRFVKSKEVRALTEGTSMTNDPKYNVFEVLNGTLRLDELTNEGASHLPESWGGDTKKLPVRPEFKPVSAKRFNAFLTEAEDNPRGGVKTSEMLTPRTEQEWTDGGFRMFISPDGKTGYALDPNGDLTGVVNNGGAKGAGGAAVQHAISQGAKTLDAFELPSEGMPQGLPGFYSKHGFVESWRGQWDDELAGKTSLSNGARPDVVGMELDPGVRRQAEMEAMEYGGSSMLAKLRSFRDNLANPHESLAVTMDSVMARMYGMKGQDWSKPGLMTEKANEVRAAAEEWGNKLGRKVMPHEIQALLWVFTKSEVGRQDFGRLLAHAEDAHDIIDIGRAPFDERAPIDLKTWDPFKGWWDEQLSYGEEGIAHREAGGGKLPPRDVPVRTRREGTTETVKEMRNETADDSGTVAKMQEKRAKYEKTMLPRIRQAMAEGNYYKAHSLVDQWVARQRRSILGVVEGDAFGTKMLEKKNNAARAMDRLSRSKYLDKPEDLRGSTGEIHQSFLGHLRGALIDAPTKDGKLMMRLFQDAALDTLVHEGGHLLRRILPGDMVADLERHYPGLQDRYGTASNVAAEEAFVSDLMHHMRNAGRNEPGGLGDVFEKIGAVLEEQYSAVLDSETGRAIPNDIAEFWTKLFNPEVVRPDAIADPINLQRVESPGLNTKKFRWESEAKFAERTRQYGEKREQIAELRKKAARAQRNAATADSAARRLWASIANEPNAVEQQVAALNGNINAALAKLGAELDQPGSKQIPQEWRKPWEAIQKLREEAKADESGQIAALLDDIPENFQAMVRAAAERGFNMTHLPDITWEQATASLFGHVRLGRIDLEEVSGRRKENTGVTSKAGLANRSMRALGAGFVDAVHEVHKNAAVADVEELYARDFTPGAIMPDGWEAWDATRQYILTGSEPTGKVIAPHTTKIIPAEVGRALRSMSEPMDHWAFHMLTRNPVFNVWRNLILTLSGKWYANNLVGNVIVSTIEGARWQDFRKAIHQWRTDSRPMDVAAETFAHSTLGDQQTILHPRSFASALKNEGIRAAKDVAQHRLVRFNSAVDEMSRSAVYNMHIRKGASAELAMTRSYKANVDYGDMSPVERGVLRNIFPFYAWQKGIAKVLMRMPVDNPQATATLMLMGMAHRERLKDELNGPIPDAYLGLNTFGGEKLGGFNPLQDSMALITPAGLQKSLNPMLDIFIRDAYQNPSPGTGEPGINAFGGKAQDVNVASAFAQQFAGAPPVRLAGQVLGGGDLYGQAPSIAEAFARQAGVPQTQDMEAIDERLNPRKRRKKKPAVWGA